MELTETGPSPGSMGMGMGMGVGKLQAATTSPPEVN